MSALTDFEGIVTERFVETGTGDGVTLSFAKKHFRDCLSVELDKPLYVRAMEKFANDNNVIVCYGSSPEFLRQILDHRFSTTFWLDAHYNGGNRFPQNLIQCSLLAELYEIVRLNWTTPPIILIDDAQMFLSDAMFERHPGYWRREDWPKIEKIDEMLTGYTKVMRSPDVLMYFRDWKFK